MEKELNIIPPIGYEIDRQKSTFEKIVFKKIDNTPKTWEDYCSLMKGEKVYDTYYDYVIINDFSDAHNQFATKERAEQFIALGKLLQLRDYWVKGYDEFDYVLFGTRTGDIIVSYCMCETSLPFTFPTREMANEFITCFRDLIKQAFPLV